MIDDGRLWLGHGGRGCVRSTFAFDANIRAVFAVFRDRSRASVSLDGAVEVGAGRGVSADILNAAIACSGIGFEGERATFTNGRVQVKDTASGNPYGDAPLRFARTRLEGTLSLSRIIEKLRDESKREPPTLEDQRSQWTLRALYYRVTLPRIAYLTQVDDRGNSIVVAESEPQDIAVAMGAGGGGYTWVPLAGKRGLLGLDLTLLLGGGSVAFHMPARLDQPASPSNASTLQSPPSPPSPA